CFPRRAFDSIGETSRGRHPRRRADFQIFGGTMGIHKTIRLIALSASLFFAVQSSAQIATVTSLVGTVSDSSGKALVGAKITATEIATQDKYSAVTNQDGNYRIDFVRVGTYDVTAEYSGFKTVRHTGSVVNINQIVRN